MDGDGNATSNTPAALMNSYVNAGFDFMTITDHNNIMGVNAAYPSVPSGLIIIGNSYENTSYNQHVVVIGATDVYTDSMLMSDIMDHHQNQLLSYAHPDFHPQYDPGYTNVRQQTDEIIAAFPDGLNFVEVYNAVVQRLNGYVDQNTDRAWDVLLNNGRKVFGIAVDDNHDLLDLNLGWVSVYASAKTKNDILLALMTGNFVASNGCVLASQPLFSAGKLTINCTSASDVTRFYSDGARNGESVTGVLAEYTISGDETYVRAVTTNLAGKKCWSQPIFITDIKAKGFLDY
jgi:hypothetical protein